MLIQKYSSTCTSLVTYWRVFCNLKHLVFRSTRLQLRHTTAAGLACSVPTSRCGLWKVGRPRRREMWWRLLSAQRLLACAGCPRTHNISMESFTATTSTWRRLSTAAGSPRSEPSSQTWLTCSECRRQSWASCLSIRNMVWRWRASLLPEMVRQVHKSTFGRLRMVRWCSPLRLGNLLQCRVLVVHVMLC